MLAIDGPKVLSIQADNRGLFEINFDRAVQESSATTTSLRISTAGKDTKWGTSDDVVYPLAGFFSNGDLKLTLYSPSSPVAQYRLQLFASKGLKGANGRALDGEVSKNGLPSGNGAPGGDLDVVTAKQSKLHARFYTTAGEINVRLYNTTTPKTVTNFLTYANNQQYEATIFHRLASGFVLQGGGFRVNKHNGVSTIVTAPAVQNEPGLHNVRGTIAMAKLGGNANSATDQFFFNLADNSSNLDNQNGGFTVFGNVDDTASLAVMDQLASAQTMDATSFFGSAFDSTPVVDLATIQSHGGINPSSDLLLANRIAVAQSVIASGLTSSTATKASVRATPAAMKATNLFATKDDGASNWLL